MRIALPIVVGVVLAVYALIDCAQTDSARIRTLNRPAWLVVIVVLPVVGPILWLTVAKARRRPRPSRPVAPPPVAPDDNPEFLRELRSIDDEHEKLLEQWESDLRRREDELREQGNNDDDPRT